MKLKLTKEAEAELQMQYGILRSTQRRIDAIESGRAAIEPNPARVAIAKMTGAPVPRAKPSRKWPKRAKKEAQ